MLGKLIVDELRLKGAKRTALREVVTLHGDVLGAFLGPYVIKLGKKDLAAKPMGKSFRSSEWKYKMETWLTPTGETIERHYWYNKITGESYYHL